MFELIKKILTGKEKVTIERQLSRACYDLDKQLIKDLLNQGADPNKYPCLISVVYHYFFVVWFSYKKSSKSRKVYDSEEEIIYLNEHLEIIDLLLQKDANINLLHYWGEGYMTPLHHAIGEIGRKTVDITQTEDTSIHKDFVDYWETQFDCYLNLVKHLIKKGANVDIPKVNKYAAPESPFDDEVKHIEKFTTTLKLAELALNSALHPKFAHSQIVAGFTLVGTYKDPKKAMQKKVEVCNEIISLIKKNNKADINSIQKLIKYA